MRLDPTPLVSKIVEVLRSEGFTGLRDRFIHPKKSALLREPSILESSGLNLIGEGHLKSTVCSELKVRGLISSSERVGSRSISFNPTLTQLEYQNIVAAFFDDDFLTHSDACHKTLKLASKRGINLVVSTEASIRFLISLSIPIERISYIPCDRSPESSSLWITRWLCYLNIASPSDYFDLSLRCLPPFTGAEIVCLSLPEHIERRAAFTNSFPLDYILVDGLRLLPAWKGCAWSYKTIATHALNSGLDRLTICEDDATLDASSAAFLGKLNCYLENTEWDVFNGIMTRSPKILGVTSCNNHQGRRMLHSNHVMGMVFNIYNKRALERIADWDPDAGTVTSNTIDEWLRALPSIKSITTVPFLAGHREDLTSTIFGFSNIRYSRLIRTTERDLLRITKDRFEP